MTNGLDKRGIWRRVLRLRTLIYFSILLGITLAVGLSIANRTPLKVDVIRDRGMPREVDEGAIENVYRLQIMNTDERPHRYAVEVNGPPGVTISSESTFEVSSATTKGIPIRVRVPANAGTPGSNPVWFVIRDTENADLRVMEKGVFLIPK